MASSYADPRSKKIAITFGTVSFNPTVRRSVCCTEFTGFNFNSWYRAMRSEHSFRAVSSFVGVAVVETRTANAS